MLKDAEDVQAADVDVHDVFTLSRVDGVSFVFPGLAPQKIDPSGIVGLTQDHVHELGARGEIVAGRKEGEPILGVVDGPAFAPVHLVEEALVDVSQWLIVTVHVEVEEVVAHVVPIISRVLGEMRPTIGGNVLARAHDHEGNALLSIEEY